MSVSVKLIETTGACYVATTNGTVLFVYYPNSTWQKCKGNIDMKSNCISNGIVYVKNGILTMFFGTELIMSLFNNNSYAIVNGRPEFDANSSLMALIQMFPEILGDQPKQQAPNNPPNGPSFGNGFGYPPNNGGYNPPNNNYGGGYNYQNVPQPTQRNTQPVQLTPFAAALGIQAARK